MIHFALYLYPQIFETSKVFDEIEFMGHSVPYFREVQEALFPLLTHYLNLPLRKADYDSYRTVHTADYLETLARMGQDQPVEKIPKMSMECTGYEYCLPGYQYSLGGLMEAVDQIKAGYLERAYCFSLGGHHAYADWGHGYCVLNPEAAAVRYAQMQGFEKVLIVDWDIHHGDGTQAIFAHDPSVYCISIHSALDLYMVFMRVMRDGLTPKATEVGHCNIPILDEHFDESFFETLGAETDFYRADESIPVFRDTLETLPFPPDLIMIFSGYDSHKDDCGAGVTNWTNEDFQRLTRLVLDKAKQFGCPVISSHGGGYKLPVTVAATISHINVLAAYR